MDAFLKDLKEIYLRVEKKRKNKHRKDIWGRVVFRFFDFVCFFPDPRTIDPRNILRSFELCSEHALFSFLYETCARPARQRFGGPQALESRAEDKPDSQPRGMGYLSRGI